MNQTELEKALKQAQDAYYKGEPIMSDLEFDRLWDELEEGDVYGIFIESFGTELIKTDCLIVLQVLTENLNLRVSDSGRNARRYHLPYQSCRK